MKTELLTIADIAAELGLPESSVRFYRDKYKPFIPTIGEGRNRRYPPAAVDVLKVASELSRSGLPSDQVTAELRRRFPVETVAITQTAAAGQQAAAAAAQADAAELRALFDAMVRRAVADEVASLTIEVRRAVADEVSGLMAEVATLRVEVQQLTAALEAARTQPTIEPPVQEQPVHQPTASRPRRWRWPWQRDE